MPTVPINLTGPTAESRSRPLSSQVTSNFYPAVQESRGVKSTYVLHSFPGYKLFSTAGTGLDRGLFEHRGILYKVTGTTLYEIDSMGTAVSLGTISGSGPCIFDGINANVLIVSDGKVSQWDGTTLTAVSDVDLESPNSATHINNQIIYDGNGGRFASSDVGDATSIDGLNYATAESNADELIRVLAHQQIVFMFGEKTVESWFNSGVGQPPFDRIEGAILQVGLGALHSVGTNDNFVYFLGDDSAVYRIAGGSSQVVSNNYLSRFLERATAVSDAIGFCFRFEGQNFYLLTVGGRTWVYPEAGGDWFNLSSGVSGGRAVINSYVFAHRKHLVSDYRNGNVYQLDTDTYSENGASIIRTRQTGPIHGGLLNAPGKSVELGRFELICETGNGVVSGQGSDPTVMLSVSKDGGRTFSTERRGRIGKLGEFTRRVEWHNLGSFVDGVIKITMSDPVDFSIYSAAADIEPGI